MVKVRCVMKYTGIMCYDRYTVYNYGDGVFVPSYSFTRPNKCAAVFSGGRKISRCQKTQMSASSSQLSDCIIYSSISSQQCVQHCKFEATIMLTEERRISRGSAAKIHKCLLLLRLRNKLICCLMLTWTWYIVNAKRHEILMFRRCEINIMIISKTEFKTICIMILRLWLKLRFCLISPLIPGNPWEPHRWAISGEMAISANWKCFTLHLLAYYAMRCIISLWITFGMFTF